jgi:hypothetical protein
LFVKTVSGASADRLSPAVMSEEHISLRKLSELRIELIDLAFVLERQGRVDAADVAVTVSVRLGELCAESVEAGTAR